jgi:acyl-CoA thioester hydrolase
MAAQRVEIDYLRAAQRGDAVQAATWIIAGDGRWRAERRFQIRRPRDGATLARARIDYVCINLDSGRAARMPEAFARAYAPGASP